MQKASLQTLTLLTTLLIGVGVNAVQAAEKSAISPDIVAPKATNSVPETPVVNFQAPPPAAVVNPVQSVQNSLPEQPVVNLQSRQSSESALKTPVSREQPVVNLQSRQSSESALKVPINTDRIEVNLQSRSPQQFKTANTKALKSEPIDVFLESRSSGCRASANQWTDACAPVVPVVASSNRSGYYSSSYSVPGFSAEIRQLSDRELKVMSLPGNGDKRLLFPLAIPAFISSTFGYRVHPITQAVRFHQGTDIAAAEGTPVLAAYSGTIEVAGWLGGLGLAVIISHDNTHETRYGHMSRILVKPGQKVKQGTPIGLVGSTGFSTGPHLHFELWQKIGGEWLALDPTNQLVAALEQLNRYLAQASKKTGATKT